MHSITDQPSGVDSACGAGEKRCSRCGECFPATTEYFSRDKKGKLGLHYWCKTCSRASGRRYKQENRDSVEMYNQRWEAEHRSERLDYKRQYREGHKGEIAAYKRVYREENRDAIAEDKRRYEAENPEKKRQREHNRRSREQGGGGKYTEADLSALYEMQQGRCCWCGRRMANRMTDRDAPYFDRFTIDHIRPIYRKGTNWPWNLVLACHHCNNSHHSKLVLLEWQPPAMLEWMADHVARAIVLDLMWHLLVWKTKSTFRLP